MLKELKLQVLRLAKGAGLAGLVLASQWRRQMQPRRYPFSHEQILGNEAS
jgi:hypothetical protein